MIRFLIKNWLLPSYIVTDQNAFTDGNWPGAKVMVLAAVEHLTGRVRSGIGMHGFYSIGNDSRCRLLSDNPMQYPAGIAFEGHLCAIRPVQRNERDLCVEFRR